ncbi:hypothetical protein GCM10011571_31960 [Marinithermofilum abyssi]|uniref:1,4-alpha-glucan branching enzyme n=1 Tax=Marinithermofilum abyssi TaxID=1571185 RepID=A0A8J2VIN2_9BACL|nr:1,4-alpha-glucan branching protein domain-containing protein [Marinithermofilum abyssi]GGE27353.1 hypothetical protein GCM10011571_31960 [Marinithermofilum abyssi]
MAEGYFSLVLHAHLPYVRHPEQKDVLEERWLFEAVTESYIPLLQTFQGLIRDGVDFRVTLSLSPTLVSMLADPLLQERTLQHLNGLVELSEKEIARTEKMPEFHSLAQEYHQRFLAIRQFFLRYDGNLLLPFKELMEQGRAELITSAATHAFLPLVLTEEAVRAQLATAVETQEHHFGVRPQGIWLPECGYYPGLDRLLEEQGLRYFFTDAHGLKQAQLQPAFGLSSPIVTPRRIAVFARDEMASQQVWSSKEGYPGDVDYREYYRDIGFDLDWETIGPYVHPDGIRINTGIKYYRITGKGDHKEPYHPGWAREKAASHAGHFLHLLTHRVKEERQSIGRQPVITAPYDAELFGHWWYEGPAWIDLLLRKIHYDQTTVKTITPTEYLSLYPDYPEANLNMSTWGRHGYADVWLREENDWIYPALHRAETRMVEMADRYAGTKEPLRKRALNQAARELMLAQGSDWAFIMDGKTMVEYAVKRTKHHINRFQRLADMVETGEVDEEALSTLEALDPIFPRLNAAHYRSRRSDEVRIQHPHRPRLLMLSWEFPPMTVGGLSRHVYDLSRHLVKIGWEVHVLTTEVEGYPHEEEIQGVHVHRVHVMRPFGEEFIHWVFQLNLMMVDACNMLIKDGLRFDLVHAHDWLVGQAAKTIKHRFGIPLVATIHATEHGRNQGIHSDLQRKIHHREWSLTYEAQRVILCSNYMKQEVEQYFQLPADKLDVIPNGVDPDQLVLLHAGDGSLEPFAMEHERIILFVGRLVQEKGVQTLLDAAPSILKDFPEAKFVIVGKGPMKPELESQARSLGLGDKVLFTGFISDEERNRLLATATVAVFPSLYEPFGIVALEAMAAGIPVVVSDVGGLADVVEHERNGLKMYPGDAFSLALQVRSILSYPDRAQRLAEAGRKEVSRFDWHRIAEQTDRVYRNVLGNAALSSGKQEIAAAMDGK